MPSVLLFLAMMQRDMADESSEMELQAGSASHAGSHASGSHATVDRSVEADVDENAEEEEHEKDEQDDEEEEEGEEMYDETVRCWQILPNVEFWLPLTSCRSAYPLTEFTN